MNLAVLKKTRRKPEVGDIFALLPPDGQFLYGRLVSDEANPLGVGDANLVYLYRARSADKSAVPELVRDELLVAPILTNRLPWSHGYFELVEHRPLQDSDKLPQHCFRDSRGWYFDERGRRLPGPVEPVGQWGLHSYRSIDDLISKVLGLPVSDDSGGRRS